MLSAPAIHPALQPRMPCDTLRDRAPVLLMNRSGQYGCPEVT